MAAKATRPRPHAVFFLSFILSFQRIERMPRQGNRHRKHGKEEEAHGEAYCEMLREAKPFFFFLTSSDPRPLLLFLLLSLFFSLSKTKKQKTKQDLTYTVRSNASRRLKVDLLKVRVRDRALFRFYGDEITKKQKAQPRPPFNTKSQKLSFSRSPACSRPRPSPPSWAPRALPRRPCSTCSPGGRRRARWPGRDA